MNASKTVLLVAAVLFCLPKTQGQEPAPIEKVIYTEYVYCLVEIEGESAEVSGRGMHADPKKACEIAKNSVMTSYPTAVCGDCVPPVMLNAAIAGPLSCTTVPTHPWKVAYKCRGSDGKLYIFLGEGGSFCEAYNSAKADSELRLSSLGVQCCSVCYQILHQPCSCKPQRKIFRRR